MKSPARGTSASKVYNRPWSGGYPGAYYGHYGAGYYGGYPYGYGGYGGYGHYGYPYGHQYGYGRGYFNHPWAYNAGIHTMGKKNWRAMFQPPEPVDPVYKYLDPISVSL